MSSTPKGSRGSEMRASDAHIETDPTGMFWAKYEATWTYLDQKRLISLDHLFHRSLEFHNNIHNFKATCMDPPSLSEDDEPEARLGPGINWRFVSDASKKRNHGSVQLGDVENYLPSLNNYTESKDGVLWIHMNDIRSLGPIVSHFNIHELCWAEFTDLRAHSNAAATASALTVTICTLQMEEDDTKLYKVYAYASEGILITFERELIPDLDLACAEEGGGETQAVDVIFAALDGRMEDLLTNVSKMGSVYMLYEIVMECLTLSNPVLEYMSRSVHFLRQQVHRDLTYNERKTNHRQIHILLSAAHLLDRHVSEWTKEVTTFLLKNSAVHHLLNQKLATAAHHPYFHDMGDSYAYRSLCLKNLHTDLRTLLATMDSVINVRAQQTNVNLSLVATIFLPITFLAGVFGMNFVEDGGYTMEVLNKKNGPDFFYALCSGVVILNVIIFLQSGYISWWSLLKFIGIRENPLSDDEQRVEALQEDARRVKEADFLRSLSARHNIDGSMSYRDSRSVDSSRLNGAGLSVDSKQSGRSARHRGRGGGSAPSSSSSRSNNQSSELAY